MYFSLMISLTFQFFAMKETLKSNQIFFQLSSCSLGNLHESEVEKHNLRAIRLKVTTLLLYDFLSFERQFRLGCL